MRATESLGDIVVSYMLATTLSVGDIVVSLYAYNNVESQ